MTIHDGCGHVFGTVLLIGFIWYVLIERERDHRKRLLISLLAMFVSLLMGMQRVYAGAHWPSDVLAGYVWGAIVLFVLIQVYRTVSRVLSPWLRVDVEQISKVSAS